jgi:UDP-N-acetylmuramate--alanine ligase
MVIVTEIYASREKKQEYSSALVASHIHHKDVHFIATLQETTAFLKDELETGDVVLILSAGDANQINQDLKENLAQASHERGEHV